MWKKLTLTLFIGGLCVYFAFKGVDFDATWRAMQDADLWIFAAAIIPLFLSHLLRTWRWGLVLRPLGQIPFLTLWAANCVGFMLVNVMPLRLGELWRPLLISQKQHLPYSSVLATCAVERVFDGLAVLIILLLGLVVAPLKVDRLPYVNLEVSWLVRSATVLFLPALLMLIGLIFLREPTMRAITRLTSILPKRFAERILTLVAHFVDGLKVLKGTRAALSVFGISCLIWLNISVMTYLTILAFHFDVPFLATFTVLGVICLGIMLPGPPGFAGNYELFCKSALALFAIAAEPALAFALASHALNIVFMIAFGLVMLPWMPISLGREAGNKMAGDHEMQPPAKSVRTPQN